MEIGVGLRVVRGPDWQWGDQDGGEGHVGTVVVVEEVRAGGRPVIVQWDCGQRCRYRCGVEGKYDLRVIDGAPTGLIFLGVRCFGCRRDDIKGLQWKCSWCHEYQLCTPCFMAGKHSLEHIFLCIVDLKGKRIKASCRQGQRKLSLRGFFPDAKVKRGYDWKWRNQDGGLGSVGVLISITDWKTETTRSVAEVKWDKSATKNVYRIGHKGKVDLACTVPGVGGFYYPEHLPVLGAPIPPINPKDFVSGDHVKTDIDMDALAAIGSAGIDEQVMMMLDNVSEVVNIHENGDLRVRYPDNSLHTVSPEATTKVVKPSSALVVGDVIRLVDDIGKVFSLQSGHGEWVDSMALALGQLGVVRKVLPSGDIKVGICGHYWIMNPECFIPAPGEVPPTNVRVSDGLNMSVQLKLMSLPAELVSEAVVQAAGAGDIETIHTFLLTSPDKVNISHRGKTLLMVAVEEGHTNIIKLLLEFNANTDLMDNSGEKVLHACAFLDFVDCAKLLLEAGTDVNTKNGKDNTPLMVAAAIGHHKILKIFAAHPNINLNQQDFVGKTALHHCIRTHQLLSIALLLDAGADPTMLDYNLNTPLHDAAEIGFLGAVEEFLSVYPQHASLKMAEDEQTPLHMAALANRYDVVKLLCQTSTCDINAINSKHHTPLHCAIINGQSRVVETLVGHGADLNADDGRGNTALHIVFVKRNAKPPGDQLTPELTKVQKELQRITHSPAVTNYMTLACFLAQEGANILARNRDGQTPSKLCPSEMIVPLMNFVNSSRRGCFHGSLNVPDGTLDPAQAPQPEAQERIIIPEFSPPQPSTRTEPSTFRNVLTQQQPLPTPPYFVRLSERDLTPRGDGIPAPGVRRSLQSEGGSSIVEMHSSQQHRAASHSGGSPSSSSKVNHDTKATFESPVVSQQVSKSSSQVSKPTSHVSRSPSEVSKPTSQDSKPPSKVSKPTSQDSKPLSHTSTVTTHVSKLQTPIEEKHVRGNISVLEQTLKAKTPDSPLPVHAPSTKLPFTLPVSDGRNRTVEKKDDGSKLKPQSKVQERKFQYTVSDLPALPPVMNDKEKPIQVESVSDGGTSSSESSPKDGANAAGCEVPCFLCEEPCNVKFEPCGHVVMCDECAKRTTKCPVCRGGVHSIERLRQAI